MSQVGGHGVPDEDELSLVKRKLAWRMGVAGLMIVALLGGLALFDTLTAGRSESEEPPVYTERVPVAKKLVAQPLKLGVPERGAEPEKAMPEPEGTAAPEVALSSAGSQWASKAGRAVPGSAPVRSATPRVPRSEVEAPTAAERQKESAPPLPVLPRAGNGFALQAGVFADARRAEELHERLAREGIPSTIETRVVVGPFNTKEEAASARVKLVLLGVEAVQLPKAGRR